MKFKELLFNIFGQRFYSFLKRIYLFIYDPRRLSIANNLNFEHYKYYSDFGAIFFVSNK